LNFYSESAILGEHIFVAIFNFWSVYFHKNRMKIHGFIPHVK